MAPRPWLRRHLALVRRRRLRHLRPRLLPGGRRHHRRPSTKLNVTAGLDGRSRRARRAAVVPARRGGHRHRVDARERRRELSLAAVAGRPDLVRPAVPLRQRVLPGQRQPGGQGRAAVRAVVAGSRRGRSAAGWTTARRRPSNRTTARQAAPSSCARPPPRSRAGRPACAPRAGRTPTRRPSTATSSPWISRPTAAARRWSSGDSTAANAG